MKLFSSILTFLGRNKKKFLYGCGVTILFVLMGDGVWAVTASGPAPEEAKAKIQTAQLFFQFLAVIMTLFTNLVGWFLSPEWTNGSLIGIGDMMKRIWILVSNLVYFAFAMIFVWIALMNIIGKDGETYKLKQAIPKFIVGVLIVPFSWFIVQFVISVSSVLTTAVLSIPYNDFNDIIKEGGLATGDFKVEVCEHGYQINTRAQGGDIGNMNYTITCNAESPTDSKIPGSKQDKKAMTISEILTNQKSSPLGILYIYSYGVMKIDQADRLFVGDTIEGINDFWQILFKHLFAVVIFVVYTLLLLALGFALFVRIVWLWMYAMLSPLFGLLYFFGKGKDGGGEGVVKYFNFKELISLAMVPVYVSAALAFGFLFLKVASNSFQQNTQQGVIEDCFSPGLKVFTICWNGSIVDSEGGSETSETTKLFKGSIGTLIGQFFALMFLWLGVMAALRTSEITKQVVEPIYQFGQSIGQIIQKGPANIPMIPVPDGKGGMTGMSATGLARAGSTFGGAIEGASAQSGVDFGNRMAGKFGLTETDVRRVKDLISSHPAASIQDQTGKEKYLGKLLSEVNMNALTTNKDLRKAFVDALKHAGVNIDDTQENTIITQGNSADVIGKNLQEAIHKTSGPALIAAQNVIGTESQYIQANINGSGGQRTPPQGGNTAGVVRGNQDGNPTITINNYNGTSIPDNPASNIQITGGTIKDDDIKKLVKAFQELGHKGKRDKLNFENMLNNSGITDESTRKNIIKGLGDKFFEIPKTN